MPCPITAWLTGGDYTAAAHRRVTRICRAVLGRVHDSPLSCDDLVSEVWLRLQGVTLRGRGDSLVYRCAMTTALDSLRSDAPSEPRGADGSLVDDWRPDVPGLRRNRTRCPLAVRIVLASLDHTAAHDGPS
jgi:DNA-directed RNA polymerase specialized sigma24 family protein